jgi:hypothetical protein
MNQEFLSWAKRQGSVSTPIGTFLGECVSLLQQYLLQVFGIPSQPRGHAKDWATNQNVLHYFDKVSTAKAGDILVYGATPNNPYGHIAIYLGDNTMLDQNGTVARKVATGKMWSNPIAILRRKGEDVAKPTYEEVLQHFRRFQGSDPTEKQMNYYVARDWGVLNGDLLVLNNARLVQARKKIKELETGGGFEKLPFDVYRKKG